MKICGGNQDEWIRIRTEAVGVIKWVEGREIPRFSFSLW